MLIKKRLSLLIMSDTGVNTKRIAKNTLYMYLRMFVTMLVSLFTTKINYQALGIDNFGIYNVVGSIIVFFTFINSGLTTATRRYITAELAQGDEGSQRNVFNLSILAHVLIALIIVVLGETVGLWAVNHLLNIPDGRMTAANIVYQLSIFTAVLNVMQAPYIAAITANERMNIYAYISIFDIISKLAVAYGVLYLSGDKLIIYAILLTFSSTSVILINRIYCHHSFAMCRFKKPHNKILLKEMFNYMGWNLAGQGMVVLTNQGVTVLVNTFFNVAANAAMGVSNQITNVVNAFVINFQVAFNPQITKLYVSRDYEELRALANRCSRISSYLTLIFIVPICFQIRNFLSLWLGDYPEYAVEFCIFTLIAIFIDAISAPLWMILSSDKDVKKYQLVISAIYSLNFIGAYLVLKMGYPPYSVIVVRMIVFLCAVIARLLLVKEKMPVYSIIGWVRALGGGTVKILLLPGVCIFVMYHYCMDNLFFELFVYGGISFVSVCFSIYMFGLTFSERNVINEKVRLVFNRFRRI